MKTIILYSLLCLVCLTSCKKCKKKEKLKYTVTGTIYKNCNDVASNTTYYIVWYPWQKIAPIELKTDVNGLFNYEYDEYSTGGISISNNTNINNTFASYKLNNESLSIGIIRESASNQLVLKLKTNHVLTNLDTIKYAFQYGSAELPIYGTITKDTIIRIFTKSINSNNYNNSPTTGEVKTLWWSLNKATVGSNDNQVDYTIHGCAGIADTAYIVVP